MATLTEARIAFRQGFGIREDAFRAGPPYREWLRRNFPHIASQPLAPRHERFWEWITALRPETPCDPLVAIWPRGGGKSTTIELGVAYVSQTLARRFVLIVCETQEQANQRVTAIRTELEGLREAPATVARGTIKFWKMDQLRTARGFNVAGYGLDAAGRGAKLDEFRPDWIVLDDLDGLHDTAPTTERKQLTLTSTILPMGGRDCAVSYTQNLILEDGIAARVSQRRSDYLSTAEVYGPEPAVRGLRTEIRDLPDGKRRYVITAGTPTWAGQDLAECERQISVYGLNSFLREAQHEVLGSSGYVFDPERLEIGEPDAPILRTCVAMDLAATENGGDWTAFGLFAALANEKTWLLDLERIQREPAGVLETMIAFAKRAFERFPRVRILVLQDPGSAGKIGAARMIADLTRAGIPRENLQTVRPRGDKARRARGAAERINSGRAGTVEAPWNLVHKSVLRAFREDGSHLIDDDVDLWSDADAYFYRNAENDSPETDNRLVRRAEARLRALGAPNLRGEYDSDVSDDFS